MEGALRKDGMVAFGPALGAERLAAIRAYLIARAQQSQADENAPAQR